MQHVRLLDLGDISPLRSQTVYHAVANALTPASPSTIILVSPTHPYVCIGYHQDLNKEVDLDYCRDHDLPVYRREVGGGAVYLDSGQVFVQWVFQRYDLPSALDARYALFVRPLVETYQALGVNAYHRPVNDIHVDGKKIGGTGAAQIGLAEVLVGSIMFDFDKATMARVLKVTSEKMRDKVFESLEQYMTTLSEQVQPPPDREGVKALYLHQAAAALRTEIAIGRLTPAEEVAARNLDAEFVTEEWLNRKGDLRPTGIKIHADVRVGESTLKAPGGLVRATVRLVGNRIDDLVLSGDFTLLPATALGEIEQSLRGEKVDPASLTLRVEAVYRERGVASPGLEPSHLVAAILSAAQPPRDVSAASLR